ncbi:MAG TPA: hypothetical protein VMI32_21950 [Candidatus Solibacter sp.]|nr:hypothetical protein [Candidatus Solibacter sp.]
MSKKRIAGAAATLVVIVASLFYGYQRWGGSGFDSRNDLLAHMPVTASGVLFIDLVAFRRSPFLSELYKWAPQTTADADYKQFLQATGFNYERDLNRVSIAILTRDQDTMLFAVADGRFDRKKISAYALQSGTQENRSGREIFSVPLSGSSRRITFTFLRDNRIALTNAVNLDQFLSPPQVDTDTEAWRERFRRLAGSPLFAVVRQDGAVGAALSAQAPGGLRSPQLSALIDQLQWITVAGKPDADRLRIVIEGEGAPDAPTRELSDVINGLLVLAQAGLSEPKMRQQLQSGVREAYLEILKSADVSQIDRGQTKSVRLIFDLTPRFLEAARAAVAAAPATPPNKSVPSRGAIRN